MGSVVWDASEVVEYVLRPHSGNKRKLPKFLTLETKLYLKVSPVATQWNSLNGVKI